MFSTHWFGNNYKDGIKNTKYMWFGARGFIEKIVFRVW